MGKISMRSLQEYFTNLFNQLIFKKDHIFIYYNGNEVGANAQMEDIGTLEELEDNYYCSLADQELEKSESSSWDSVKSELGL